ncbi:hypothetical protein ACKGLS_000414 [Vibrio alginolyticus]|nr:hypothetical protein [Vibrio alginolyticus]ELB2280534.1 hypothetical protein [Vibrio alginolyticus]
MKSKILYLLMLVGHTSAYSATTYQVNITVTESNSKLVFPTFEVSTGGSGTSFTDGCTYVGTLTEESKDSILLEAKMSCIKDDSSFRMDMPGFVLESEGQKASYELLEEDDGVVVWKYSVEVEPLL